MLDLRTYELRARPIYGRSLEKRLIILRQYGRFLEEMGLEPGVESLNLWVDELVMRGMSPGSIQVYVYAVLSYFNLMMLDVDERKLRLLKMRLPRVESRPVDYLTEDEVRRLIEAAPPPRNLIYALIYAYARRLGEVLALRRGDVDLRRNTVTFNILKKKSEERATYPLEPWIRDMLVRYDSLLGRDRLFPVTEEYVEQSFKRDCARAGIRAGGRRLRPHILRHSRITHLRERGVPLDVVSKYLARHSRYDITVSFYRAVTEEEVASIPSAGEVLGLWASGGGSSTRSS